MNDQIETTKQPNGFIYAIYVMVYLPFILGLSGLLMLGSVSNDPSAQSITSIISVAKISGIITMLLWLVVIAVSIFKKKQLRQAFMIVTIINFIVKIFWNYIMLRGILEMNFSGYLAAYFMQPMNYLSLLWVLFVWWYLFKFKPVVNYYSQNEQPAVDENDAVQVSDTTMLP
jgi:hypothetical protein